MSIIAERIEGLMNRIQSLVEVQDHVYDPAAMQMLLSQVNIYWAHMDDEDKDYIHAVTDAMKEGREWKNG
jgi:hypothetical protein